MSVFWLPELAERGPQGQEGGREGKEIRGGGVQSMGDDDVSQCGGLRTTRTASALLFLDLFFVFASVGLLVLYTST
jgi:hypothetical protein